jgi:phosphoribosylformylglycinamidine synthase II
MQDTEIKVTLEIAAEHGLAASEYGRVCELLGRAPSITELGIFSVMWSEHCSYKSSKVHLRRLPTRGPQVIQGPGENAGVVDIGDGLCAVFKIESHNHPSFVEPFQGAATGVGGILRDIFTMGARPIAVFDSLRFGPISPQSGTTPAEVVRNRRLLDGVVSGIAFYGNCFGVPTAGGEVLFEPCYSSNPLVNVLALGLVRRDELFFARARGEGNPVIYVGARTGRDGIHGASLLASAEFSEESRQKRPNVQVGDPFMEKLLLEACLEAMRTGAVVAIQDMGAAGLTSSSSEMASRGGLGIEMDLDCVPQRETGMTPYEIMLSESQERMLLIAERGRQAEVVDVFRKWGLDAVEIGQVVAGNRLRVLENGRVVADIPVNAIAEEAPVYERPLAAPLEPSISLAELAKFAGEGEDLTGNFRQLLGAPAIASKRWIFEQYDYMVRTNTLVPPGAGDAAVLRVKDTTKALALSVAGNGRWCQLAPRVGAMHAVAEAARNVACSGAHPLAATNCLNFGNPEKPEIMWQFSEAIDGIAEACTALGIPITGGNVSFYNETLGKAIYPTPVLGVLGLLEDAGHALAMAFQFEDDAILLLDGSEPVTYQPGDKPEHSWTREFSSSEYARTLHSIAGGEPPAISLAAEKRLGECLHVMAMESVIRSAHDLSDGGFAVALAESCFASSYSTANAGLSLGAHVAFEGHEPAELALFGERGARAIVSASPESLARLFEIAAQYGVGTRKVGRVTRGEFRILYNRATVIHAEVGKLHREWAESLERDIRTR